MTIPPNVKRVFSGVIMIVILFMVLATTGFILKTSLESDTSNTKLISRVVESEFVQSSIGSLYAASFNAFFTFVVSEPNVEPERASRAVMKLPVVQDAVSVTRLFNNFK